MCQSKGCICGYQAIYTYVSAVKTLELFEISIEENPLSNFIVHQMMLRSHCDVDHWTFEPLVRPVTESSY